MKKLPVILLLLVFVSACKLDPVKDAWEYYEDWRNENETWLAEQTERTGADGMPFYQRAVPEYDRNAYVLIHYYNDRSLTSGNLSPLATSTVDVKYKLTLCNGEAVDSTYNLTVPGDSLIRMDLSGESYIPGFRMALMEMRVGDSCDVIIPYQQGYGNTGKGPVLPYSHLRFSMKLADIPGYEKSAD